MLRGRIVLLHHLPEPVGRRPEGKRGRGGAVLRGRGGPLEQLIVEHAVHVQAGQQAGREHGRRGGRNDGRRHHRGRGDYRHRSVFAFHEVQRFHHGRDRGRPSFVTRTTSTTAITITINCIVALPPMSGRVNGHDDAARTARAGHRSRRTAHGRRHGPHGYSVVVGRTLRRKRVASDFLLNTRDALTRYTVAIRTAMTPGEHRDDK